MTEKNIITYEIIINKLNEVFNDIEKTIRDFIKKNYKIKTRKTKLTFTETFIYSILCTEINKTKIDIVNELNVLNTEENKINRTTIYEKEIKIPFEFYVFVFQKLTKLYNDIFDDEHIKKLVAVDGTYNNTNVFNIKELLETSLNMGFFDINNEIPIDLTFNGIKNKNNELKVLIDYINNNKEKFTNVILVLDRAYCSYKFINLLNKKNINFVCRFRNNCKNFENCKNNRIIKFTNLSYENVENNNIENHLIDNKKFSKC